MYTRCVNLTDKQLNIQDTVVCFYINLPVLFVTFNHAFVFQMGASANLLNKLMVERGELNADDFIKSNPRKQ